jgi:hypothetical protein
MHCQTQHDAFNAAILAAQAKLTSELTAIAQAAEQGATALSGQFKHDNDLGEGVAAAAGTAIGTAVGGPVGGAIGGALGGLVGNLLTVEVREELVKFKMDLPEIVVRDQEWLFDLPEVTMRDNDIIFHVPTMVMRTVRGPDLPEVVTEMVTQCIGGGWSKICADVPQVTTRWKATYFDQPFWENREQRIVLGLPSITMKTQRVVVGVPEFAMRAQELSFSVPSITVRFVQDAGKALAAAAETLAKDVTNQIDQKRAALKEKMKADLIPVAKPLFDCYRSGLVAEREKIAGFFNSQLDTIANTIITLTANQVGEDQPVFQAARAQSAKLIEQREQQLIQFDTALARLDDAFKTAIDKALG